MSTSEGACFLDTEKSIRAAVYIACPYLCLIFRCSLRVLSCHSDPILIKVVTLSGELYRVTEEHTFTLSTSTQVDLPLFYNLISAKT